MIERIPVTMDVSSVPRRNSYTEGATKQNHLLAPENKLQKHGSDSSLGTYVGFGDKTILENPNLFEVTCISTVAC
jgi:hypothetical protein